MPTSLTNINYLNFSRIYNFLRKMMNRVAAQNARDRRKNYVEDLEKRVALLEQQVLWCAHSQFICLTRSYQFVLVYLEQTAAAGEPITEGALRYVSC